MKFWTLKDASYIPQNYGINDDFEKRRLEWKTILSWCVMFKIQKWPKNGQSGQNEKWYVQKWSKRNKTYTTNQLCELFLFFFYIYYLASYLYSFYLWNHVGLLPCYCYYCTVSIIIQKILHVAWSQTHNVKFFSEPKIFEAFLQKI